MKTNAKRFNSSWILAAAAAAVFVPIAGAASPAILNGGGANNNWSTALNWNNNLPAPSTTYDLQFGGTTRLSATNDFGSGSSFRNITFNAGAFTLAGNSITLNGNITNSSSNL